MKKVLISILAAIMILSLAACGKKEVSEDVSQPVLESETEKQTESKPVEPEPAETESDIDTADDGTEVLDLQKEYNGLYEWDDDMLLVQSEFSHVTLWFDDAEKYPELAQTLEQTAAMIQRSMEEEFDNFCVMAREESQPVGENRETWISTVDVQVRRADSVVISLLSDSYADYGRIEDFRGMHGSNIDARTGQEIKLTDVITDLSRIPGIVTEELNSHMWAGDFYSDTAVEDYFRNTPVDGISWTLDYNGVTFYFTEGDLAEAGYGRLTATVDFARYPELFSEKYMTVPDAYMVELPMNHSFFTDLNGDGDLEELNVTGFFDSDVGFYTKFGIYTDTDGYYHYEECFADGFIPYYVKTAEGGHYLYLFCRENEGADMPMATLRVIDVSNGKLAETGTMHAGPGYIPMNIFRVPTDPERFYLDDYDGMAQDMMPYSVGANGIPVSDEESAGQNNDPEGYTVTVSSAEELLEAVGPDVGILIEPGYYNLSEYIEYIWEREGEKWNERHPYVQLRDCFDGVEVVIRRVNDMIICGDNENLTEIVVDPRYAQVLNFEECYNISLSGLTMGHTETGDCSGNVIDFYGCRNITLSAMDLYGCGVYGIGCYDGTGELYAYTSTIRDCAYGALEISDGVGRFEFHNCMLSGSEGYDRYEESHYSELAFYECTLGIMKHLIICFWRIFIPRIVSGVKIMFIRNTDTMVGWSLILTPWKRWHLIKNFLKILSGTVTPWSIRNQEKRL